MGEVDLTKRAGKSFGRILLTAVAAALVFGNLSLATAAGQGEMRGVPKAAPAPEGNGPEQVSTLTFMGVVEPGRLFRLILQPGETLQQLSVAEGQTVAEGQPLARLTSDSLSGAKFDLLQKQLLLKKDKQQLELAALEIQFKERQLAKIEEQMAEEKKLVKQVEGYISSLSVQLEREKSVLQGELELLRARIGKARDNAGQTTLLDEMLDRQTAQVIARLEMLDVRAPFAGTAAFVSPEGIRTPPGGVVCEIWSDTAFRVRGKIMQHQMKYLRTGDRVEIALDFSESKPTFGKVLRIQQSVGKMDTQGGYPSFDVLVEVDGRPPWIQAGMLVSLKKSLLPQGPGGQ